MSKLSINLADYGYQSQEAEYGSVTQENVNDLNKALEAGAITGRDTVNLQDASGSPLKVESLEKTLKHLTFKESDIRLWKDIPKKAAFNTVEEYNQQVSYGQDRGGFNNEGELPEEEDSTYVRRAQFVKYLGVTKSVTHQMTLVTTMIGSVMERTIKDGTLWILRKLNKSLYFGNEKIVPQEFNGFIAQQTQADAWATYKEYMTSENVIDLRNSALTEDSIESGANSIVENYGLGTQIYAAPAVLSNFVKNFYGNKFIQPNSPALSNGVMGQKVQAFDSQFGQIGLNHDVFFKKLPSRLASAAASTLKAPNAPVWDVSTPIAVVASVDGSKHLSTEVGAVIYAVSALNRYGESALAVHATPATTTTGCRVDLKFATGGGTNAATGYRIYRTKVGGTVLSEFFPLFDVSLDDLDRGYDSAAATKIGDMGRFLPDTDQALLIQFDNEVVEFAQLAPLMKMDLAILSPAFRFMVMLYGTPFLYAPKKMVRMINIGKTIG